MQRRVSDGSRQISAARLWAPLARFIELEAAIGERAAAHGPAAHALYEFARFGMKQAWACLFGAIMLGLLIATHLFYPRGGALPRYDFLVVAAVLIQVLMLALRLETWEEAKIIFVFHVVGTVMEVFKTSVGSWVYPEESLLRVGGVRSLQASCMRLSAHTSPAAGAFSISGSRSTRRFGASHS